MKKKLSYRDKLIELAHIYDVKEIKDYEKRRKNLTTGQLELILKKNKIIIPKDFKTNFFKENFTKPLSKVSKQIDDFKEDSSKKASKFSRQIGYFKEDSSRSFSRFLTNLWRSTGNIGLGVLNILSKLRLIDFSDYHNKMLVSNLVLDTSKIEQMLKFNTTKSNADLMFEAFEDYNNNHLNNSTGSSKKPRMGFFKIIKFFSKFI